MAELIYPYLPFLSFAIYNSPMTKAPHSNETNVFTDLVWKGHCPAHLRQLPWGGK